MTPLAVQFTAPIGDLALTVAATIVGFAVVIGLTRVYGLRAFAKMAPFDFAATIAIGSLLASTALGAVPVLQGLMALGTLYGMQRLLALARRNGAEGVLDNTPLLLMSGGEVLRENLREGGVTESDLRAKLREANVLDYDHVRAVVLEATGDVSVLHDAGDTPLNRDLLEGVRQVPAEAPTTWTDGPPLVPPS